MLPWRPHTARRAGAAAGVAVGMAAAGAPAAVARRDFSAAAPRFAAYLGLRRRRAPPGRDPRHFGVQDARWKRRNFPFFGRSRRRRPMQLVGQYNANVARQRRPLAGRLHVEFDLAHAPLARALQRRLRAAGFAVSACGARPGGAPFAAWAVRGPDGLLEEPPLLTSEMLAHALAAVPREAGQDPAKPRRCRPKASSRTSPSTTHRRNARGQSSAAVKGAPELYALESRRSGPASAARSLATHGAAAAGGGGKTATATADGWAAFCADPTTVAAALLLLLRTRGS